MKRYHSTVNAIRFPRRALLSVSDKSGLLPFATGLVRLGFELVSTGGTARALREGGLEVTDVAAAPGIEEGEVLRVAGLEQRRPQPDGATGAVEG